MEQNENTYNTVPNILYKGRTEKTRPSYVKATLSELSQGGM